MTCRPRPASAQSALVLLLVTPLLMASLCEGDGDSGSPPVAEVLSSDPRCVAVSELFPSGFADCPTQEGRQRSCS